MIEKRAIVARSVSLKDSKTMSYAETKAYKLGCMDFKPLGRAVKKTDQV